ncbi:DUF4282 domain-containing protein [Dietzia sp.]|uniref:DUF4282 domain-containing protein n=1 Tax=Dietzia sp. TaxID=1871616 RepID=UPI002FDAB936
MSQPPGSPDDSSQTESLPPYQGHNPGQGSGPLPPYTGQWGQWGAPGPQFQPAQKNPVESRGFFGAVFDFTFRSLVSIRFAKFLYIVAMVYLALGWLFGLVVVTTGAAYDDEYSVVLVVILYLVFAWIPFFIQLLLVRVFLEFVISTVRTSQNTAATRAEIGLLRDELRGRP